MQLIGPENSRDLTAAITNLYDTYYDKNNYYQKTTDNGYNDMWDPNREQRMAGGNRQTI